MTESYKDFPRPAVTCDVVAVTDEAEPRVLLILRGHDPGKGLWALPGGFVDVGDVFVDQGEDIDVAAYRELEEETGLTRSQIEAAGAKLVQVGAVGTPYRDARQRIITVVWAVRLPVELVDAVQAGDDADDARWFPVDDFDRSNLAFDHASLLEKGLARLSQERNV